MNTVSYVSEVFWVWFEKDFSWSDIFMVELKYSFQNDIYTPSDCPYIW